MFFDNLILPSKKSVIKAPRKVISNDVVAIDKPFELMSDAELMDCANQTMAFDVEMYPNYFLISFKCMECGKVVYFELGLGQTIDIDKLSWIMHRFLIIGFNSRNYDNPMVLAAIKGYTVEQLYELTRQLIFEEKRFYENNSFNHIDLIEVAPLKASLKIYGGRLHCEYMQDLPFHPSTILTQEQANVVKYYNINDLDNTILLYNNLLPQIKLREQLGKEYGQDLRSKSDAQIAETVIVSELKKIGVTARNPTIEPEYSFRYCIPSFIKFQTPVLQNALEVIRDATFVVGTKGSASLPAAIKALRLRIGACVYRMGIGGLHSSEKSVKHIATEETLLIDRDVASFYPRIILNQGLYPKHIVAPFGANRHPFLKAYETIVDKRLAAKAAKDMITSDGLKIAINGTFGKLGNKYSKIYSPDLLTQVTISGQLCLLMLIEMIECVGIPVVSANTDGIIIKCPQTRYDDLNKVIAQWEGVTSFETEETRYTAIYSRDCNNYIAFVE